MIRININGDIYEVDREELEDTLLENGLPKLEEALNNIGLAGKQMISSSIGALLGFMGLSKPKELKDMDNIEYATMLSITMLLDSAEGKTLYLPNAKKVDNNE